MRKLGFIGEHYYNEGVDEGLAQGFIRGVETGRHNANLVIARRLRCAGMTDDFIQDVTELSLDDIHSLDLVEA